MKVVGYRKKYVSKGAFLHPSILQTDCRKHLFKKIISAPAQQHCSHQCVFTHCIQYQITTLGVTVYIYTIVC